MSLEEVKKSYKDILDSENKNHSKLNKAIFQIGTLRLVIIVACIIVVYLMWGNTTAIVSTILLSTVVFTYLVIVHNKLFRRRLYAEIKIKNAQDELKALEYDFSAFDGGNEYINAEHSFSLDLDIFGNRSFFQSLNRTVTSFGKDKLADTILFPHMQKEEIVSQQESIKELTSNPKLLMHFRTMGMISEGDNMNIKDFGTSFDKKPFFYQNKFWAAMTYITPLLFVLWLTLFILNVIPGGSFLYLWVMMLFFSSIALKKARLLLSTFEKKTSVLEKYINLFTIIEGENFNSTLLKNNSDLLTGDVKASETIKKLKSYQDNLQLSFVFPVFLLLNPILLWNVRYAIAIEKWINQYHSNVEKWFGAVAQFDALVSLSTFAYNHPDYTYPEISDSFVFEGKALGHPMINRDICVKNDVSILQKPYFLVITGANMAGKSTYLRTIGINHTMACAGMPVCAERLLFYPGQLVTNLRTADSLADNESYFFAELKRLKMIIDRLQSGEELFIILDEILKGTNSEDKQKGSLALMKQLVSLKGNGLIATHDLALGKLEEEFPYEIKNYCFESEIKDGHLSFSYKIREGIAQNMNASFLMKKMGITGL